MTVNDTAAQWSEWVVSPTFRVADPSGRVGMAQLDDDNFAVTTAFEFVGTAALDDLRKGLRRAGKVPDVEQAIAKVARFAPGDEGPHGTDLASVPPFMRWFVNTYGAHTLAAIVHDRLITDGGPNQGELMSDTLSDRFFRQMMRAAGVPWLKRWIMWAAVAMRTRWAAKGWRRLTLLVWVALAATGITVSAAWFGAVVLGWPHLAGLSPTAMAIVALVMPFVSSALWGRQFGASLVAAVAALWILPGAALAAGGFAVYRTIESGIARFSGTRDEPVPPSD
jgi:hypothetical protein